MISEDKFVHLRDYYLVPVNQWARERVERVLASIDLRPGERVLDLGCGVGTFSFHALAAGACPVGLDLDTVGLTEGREAAMRTAGCAAPRVRGDARRLPFPDGAFDVVINADFIEHTPEEAKPVIFREMRRVLREGGRAIVYTPNRERVEWEVRGERLKKAVGLRKSPVPTWLEVVDPDHYGMTTPYLVATQLREAGFRTKIHYFEFHVPGFSRLPGFNFVAEAFLAPFFANRFLIQAWK